MKNGIWFLEFGKKVEGGCRFLVTGYQIPVFEVTLRSNLKIITLLHYAPGIEADTPLKAMCVGFVAE